MPGNQIDIGSKTCSIEFMSGPIADQPMTSISCWSRNVTVWQASCTKVSLGQLAGSWNQHPTAKGRFITVLAVMCLLKRRIICIFRRGAEMKRFIPTMQSKWRASHGIDILLSTHALGSPLASFAPQHFTNTTWRHVQNSEQNNFPQISRHGVPNN